MPSAPHQHTSSPPHGDKPNTSRPRSLIASSLDNAGKRNALDHSFAAVETAITRVLNTTRSVIPFPAGRQGRAVGARPAKTADESIPLPYVTALSAGLHLCSPIVVPLFFLIALLPPKVQKVILPEAARKALSHAPTQKFSGLQKTLLAAALVIAVILSWLAIQHFLTWMSNDPKKADMTFTLVKDTQAKKPVNPRFRGQFNQQAGGETNPNQPIAPPDTPESTASAAQQAVKPTPPQPTATPPQPTPKPKTQNTPKTTPVKSAIHTPKKPTPKPQQAQPSPNQQAAQSQRPQQTASAASSTASAGTPGSGISSGNAQGGKGAAGVNVAADVDFGPFMSDLERRIKRNWHPPRAGNSKKVKVQFHLARDGRLLDIDILGHSGDPSSDTAAIEAVRASAPFRPFPPGVREESLPIEFTFDYNVFNPRGR